MHKKIKNILLIILLGINSSLFCQIDTVFWFAAPWVTVGHSDNKPVILRLSTFNNPTTIRVRQPAGTFDTTFTVPANSLYSKSLSHVINQIENTPANTVLNRGLKITSNHPITAIYNVLTQGLNPETYSLKGQNGLGFEFVCPFQTNSNNSINPVPTPKSQISIVASQNNTTIWITPRCNVVGHLAGISYSISLNIGQSYNIENVTPFTSVAGQNLGGTIIFSNKPISVSVTDDSVNGYAGCYDLMGDQIVPVEVLGNEYIVNKGDMYANQFEGAYIVATENFTQIIINDGNITTTYLNKGDTYFYKTTQVLTHIQGDKPIYVIHASGFGCELGEAIIPPLNCAGSNQVSFTRTSSEAFILNILCKTTSISNFRLNGNSTLVPASNFTVVPGTGGVWSGFRKSFSLSEIPVGITCLLTNTNTIDPLFAMGVISGGYASGTSYHYMSSFLRKVNSYAGADQNICTSTNTISLTGIVDGGTTNGVWTVIGGTGTFANSTNLNTTYTLSPSDLNLPRLKFILTSTGNCTPVSDTLVVNIFKSPMVFAGPNVTLCKNNVSPIALQGTLNYAAGATWTSNGNGSFANTGALNTTYLPSPSDLSSNSVTLTLTTSGSLNNCPNTLDTLVIHFTDSPVVQLSPDISVCANNATVAINGTVSAGASTGVWLSNGTGLFSPSTTSLNTIYQLSPSDIINGNVIIKLTSTFNGNCLAVSDSLVVTVNSAPSVNAGINDTICSSNIFYNVNGIVNSNSQNFSTWSTLGNGSFSNASSLNTIYTLGSTDTLVGKVKLILSTNVVGCLLETDTLQLIIAKSPIVNAGIDGQFCDNHPILVNGSVNGLTTSGVWQTFGTGMFTPNDSLLTTYYQPSALDISNGYVNLLLTSTYNKGCGAVNDTLKITFKPSPSANFILNNECVNKNVSFIDNSSTTTGSITNWWWDFGDLNTATTNNANHIYSTPGSYTVTHVVNSNNNCNDTIKKSITIYFPPNAFFYQNTPCVGNVTQFIDSTKTLSGSIISWNWNFGDGTTSGIQNPQHAFNNVINYSVSLIVTSSFGCKDTISKVVTVIGGPTANFNINPNPVEALSSANLTDLSTSPGAITNWNWYFGDNAASIQQNPTHTYNDAGTFSITLVVKDINGCIDTTQKEILVVLLPDIPTAFSPNGDGENDYFLVRGGPFKSIHVRIYNNWGQLIYETNDQLAGWNGTLNGTEQPIGVYVWVVDVEMFTGRQIKKTGDVTLLR